MRIRTLLPITFGFLGLVFIGWIALFTMVDSDVWWHIKAGQVMWQTKNWITVDPFAYTRAGLPYLATHEWLTQLLFAAFYGLGGSTGIIFLRILCTLAVFGILLSIDRKNLWPNVLIAMAAAIAMRQGMLERPQMVSNVFFAVNLVLSFWLMNDIDDRVRKRILGALIGMQIIWVNMHGAEALLSFMLLGCVFFQELADKRRAAVLKLLALGGVGLFLAMFVSPNFHHNFTYVWLLFTDQTADFIKEWSPHPWPAYLLKHGAFWIIAVASIVWSRRSIVGSGLLLLAAGILSRTGSRHEVLFTIAAVGVTFYQLAKNAEWEKILTRAREWWHISALTSLVIVGGLAWIDAPVRAFLAQSNLSGFGSFAPAEGAADFLEANRIQGRIYNTYAVGGYLLFRGIPVFLDGRNVDYGYEFLSEALDAQSNPALWKTLEKKYAFTVAIMEYTWSNADTGSFHHLNSNPDWALVYVDDWVAVYLKNVPENRDAIGRFRYTMLTSTGFENESILENVSPAQYPQLQQELLRAVADDGRSIGPLLTLAELYAMTGHFPEAIVAATEASQRAPARFEPYALLGGILAAEGKWTDAREAYQKAIDFSAGQNVTLNYAKIAEIFERAGDSEGAERMREMAQ
ncbi:hypothetical protein HZA87_03105 [Candidatus Uhrbacteria bacterium]|nr:hypothetical protein [Candidatus Uhrbacteria bacterium]